MCCMRCSATTAPSMASHRNRIEASSSLHTNGWWNTKRLTTPASSTKISISTSNAVGTSTALRRPVSMREIMGPITGRLGKVADGLLEHAPRFGAELALPLFVEAGALQLGTERRRVGLDELHALALQRLGDGVVHLGEVLALGDGRGVELRLDDLAQVGGQRLPRLLVGQEPEAVPHVVGDGAILLHLVELGRVDQRQRILLAVDHVGLQRGVDLAEVDRGWRCAEGLEQAGPQRRHRNADLETRDRK